MQRDVAGELFVESAQELQKLLMLVPRLNGSGLEGSKLEGPK